MSTSTDILSKTMPNKEVAEAELGDVRRARRYGLIMEALARRPDRSIPDALGDEAAQEGYCRFIRSEHIEPDALLEPHIEATEARAETLPHVLCVHDTTEFSWGVRDNKLRENLGRLSVRRQGFRGHSSIVTSADDVRALLGTVAAQPFVHKSVCPDEATLAVWEERGGIFPNEKCRWYRGIEEAEARLDKVQRVTSTSRAQQGRMVGHTHRRAVCAAGIEGVESASSPPCSLGDAQGPGSGRRDPASRKRPGRPCARPT